MSFVHNGLTIIIINLLVAALLFVNCSDDEYRLLQDLKERYDPIERPVQNHTEAVKVSLRLYLQQIVDVDEKNQVLTVVLWEEFRWFDYKMRWDPREYGGIKKIRFPTGTLWRPDVLLFNSADENFDARFDVNFVVNNDGSILYSPPAIIKSSCRIDITWFPFDEQLCLLKFGPWTHQRYALDLCIDGEDTIYYVPNGEWDLISTPANISTPPFGDEGDSFIELNFYIHIKRKIIYYGMNWIVPSVLFLLSNVLGFTMPAECGEKITLQTTNLLSVTVFLGMVADITPPTSDSVPIIAAFFSIAMVILGSSIIFTLLIINVHFRSPRTHKGKQFRKPKLKRRTPRQRPVSGTWTSEQQQMIELQQRGGQSLQEINTRQQHLKQRIFPKTIQTSDSSTSRGSTSLHRHQQYTQESTLIMEKSSTPLLTAQSISKDRGKRTLDDRLDSFLLSEYGTTELLRSTLRELSDYLHLSQQKMDEEEEEEEAKADWRFMAMSLDRACLFLYAFICCALPLWIFTATPKYILPVDPTEIVNPKALCSFKEN
uniref:Neur_chan_LBD domain-containing protein n=1 Tax=Meloidogyne hapla TaxID=6305 RepID=A0A1I8BSG2_MELHA